MSALRHGPETWDDMRTVALDMKSDQLDTLRALRKMAEQIADGRYSTAEARQSARIMARLADAQLGALDSYTSTVEHRPTALSAPDTRSRHSGRKAVEADAVDEATSTSSATAHSSSCASAVNRTGFLVSVILGGIAVGAAVGAVVVWRQSCQHRSGAT